MPAKINLTEKQINEMVHLRVDEKMTYEQIALKMNVSHQTVKRRLSDKLGSKLDEITLRYQFDRHFFHIIDSREKAYWLGFITADGYVNEDRGFLSFHLQWSDKEHLEKFLKAIQAEDRIKVKQERHSITGNLIASLTLNSKELVRGLVNQGIFQGKSNDRQPPKNVPEDFIADYIRGLWDGDGHIAEHKIDLRNSFNMCAWVQNWFFSKCKISKCKILYDSNIYRLYICKGKLEVLKVLYYPYVSQDICLTRKYNQAKLFMLNNLKLKESRPEAKFV